MIKNCTALLVMLALGLVFPCAAAELAGAPQKSVNIGRDDSVRTVLIGLQDAIKAKNLENATQFFAENIHFIDQAGEEVRGRKELRDRFDRLFKSSLSTGIGIHPQAISFLADSVALVVGEVSRKREQADSPASRFSMVLVRIDKRWLITEMTETTMLSLQTESHLQELNWLIGEWQADNTKGSAQMTVEWTPNKKFITSKCTLKKNGETPQIDSQVIGWDPRNNSIISWHFDSNGGFGNGTWSNQPNERAWTVDVEGVGADGSNTTASNVFTLKTPDEFLWQSVRRSLDGAGIADTETITVHRIKH